MTPDVAASVHYLASDAAARSIARDPYWPKWDSPWWHMTLLWELGRAGEIPRPAAALMAEALDRQYRGRFPDGLGEQRWAYKDVAWCQCSLGTMVQVLSACGVAVDEALPWALPWLLRHQLPDGGLNCDEAAYAKPAPKSSVVSTLPPLEAVLARSTLSTEEEAFLDRGAAYLIAHRLFRAAGRDGRVLNAAWLKPCFPRFYDYDVLRGLTFLARWSRRRGKPFPAEAAADAMAIMEAAAPDGRVIVGRSAWRGEKTLLPGGAGRALAPDFDLLRAVGETGEVCEELTRDWREVRETVPARVPD